MFGLALHSSVALAGCPPGPAPDSLPLTRLRTAAREEVTAQLPADAQPIGWRVASSGRPVADVLAHPEAGYGLPAPGFGAFHISASGRRILAAPNAIAAWRWQRYLIGRVLPFAALLQGLEPLHASAVATPTEAVLIVGAAGAGKSTLAAALLGAGLTFVADDVVALQLRGGAVLAHPGAPLLSMRPSARGASGSPALRGLGDRVGADRLGLRLSIARTEAALPVCAVYLLGGDDGAQSGPARLLGATFNAIVRDPSRVQRQLDVCASLARSARLVALPAVPGGDPSRAMARILSDLDDPRTQP
jgi:hypothetical protein